MSGPFENGNNYGLAASRCITSYIAICYSYRYDATPRGWSLYIIGYGI